MGINSLTNKFKTYPIAITRNNPKMCLSPKNNKYSPRSHNELRGLCADFEAIFISFMLKAMRNTTFEKNGLFPLSNERKIFQSLFDNELANQISHTTSFGISSMLYNQLKDYNPHVDKKIRILNIIYPNKR